MSPSPYAVFSEIRERQGSTSELADKLINTPETWTTEDKVLFHSLILEAILRNMDKP